jgi:hypothetical protein
VGKRPGPFFLRPGTAASLGRCRRRSTHTDGLILFFNTRFSATENRTVKTTPPNRSSCSSVSHLELIGLGLLKKWIMVIGTSPHPRSWFAYAGLTSVNKNWDY